MRAETEEILYELALVHNFAAEDISVEHGTALEERDSLAEKLLGPQPSREDAWAALRASDRHFDSWDGS